MSTVQRLINQQMGIANWNTCDSVFGRLRCYGDEEFTYGIDGEEGWCTCACKFAQKQGQEHVLALASENGHINIMDAETKRLSSTHVHCNVIFDVAWLPGRMQLITASGDHTASLVDVSEAGVRVARMFTRHTGSVKTIATRKDDCAVFATGSRDGNIFVWDTRSYTRGSFFTAAPDKEIRSAHCGSKSGLGKRRQLVASGISSITGLGFQDENTLISCSAGDGTIKVWDLRKTYKIGKVSVPRHEIPNRKGFNNLMIDRSESRLYVGCLDNAIYCYNILTYNHEPTAEYRGHRANTFFVKSCLSPDGNYLLSGSSDNNAYIWNLKSPKPLVRLKGHNAEVTCVGWCENPSVGLITCSDDLKQKLWKIGTEDLPENWEIDQKGTAEVINHRREILPRNHYNSVTFPNSRKSDLDLSDLPNFNIDGLAPHMNFSPEKKQSSDWLTRLRVEKRLFRRASTLTTSPRQEESPRRGKRKREERPQSPLSKFFKVTHASSIRSSSRISKRDINSDNE